METAEAVKSLYDKDNTVSYRNSQKMEFISNEDNSLYKYIDEFTKMLENEKSFIRVRGFRMICAQAKWDIGNKIDSNIDKILSELDDEKPTAVRQCLAVIDKILIYKAELTKMVLKKLNSIDSSKYKDSMKGLIEKDIEKIVQTYGKEAGIKNNRKNKAALKE